MSVLARVFFYGYAAMLVGVGASGIIIAGWELPVVFAVDTDAMSAMDEATFLNQYRFLKSMELGFGLFCIVFRRGIFRDTRFYTLFLMILGCGVGARMVSVMVDGVPSWPFLVFIVLEAVTGVLVWFDARRKPVTA